MQFLFTSKKKQSKTDLNKYVSGQFCYERKRYYGLWTLIDGLDWCGLHVHYYDVLLAVQTLILTAPIHCRRSIRRNKLIYILDGLRVSKFTFTFTFSHLADAFIQSDLQLGNT